MTARHLGAGRFRFPDMAAIHRYWYPLLALTRREIKKRYATTLLGSLWTVLLPLATLAIYLMVFGFILRAGQTRAEAWDFAFNMLAGLLPFQALADALHRACTSLREDRSLLEREQFPGEVLPATRVLSTSVAEAVGIVLLTLAAALYQGQSSPLIVALPAAIFLRILLTLGLAWIVSVLSVFVADVAEILAFLLTAWLFLTPIFYTPASVPDVLSWTLAVNPLHHLAETYRGIILHGHLPGLSIALATVSALATAAAGIWFFRRTIERTKDFF